MSISNTTNASSSSGSGKGQWSKKREEVYMEQMNILNPPCAGHGDVTKTWEKVREIVNNVDRDLLKPLSKRSIEGKYHELLANYKEIDDPLKDKSASNEPCTKLDRYIIEYKKKLDVAKKKKTKEIEKLRKDMQDAQDVILERMIASGSDPVAFLTGNKKGKRKATDDGQPEGSQKKVAVEDNLSGSSHTLSDGHMIQNLRDEMQNLLAEKEREASKINRQMGCNMKEFEDKIDKIAEKLDFLAKKVDKVIEMIEQLAKETTSQRSLRRLAPAENK